MYSYENFVCFITFLRFGGHSYPDPLHITYLKIFFQIITTGAVQNMNRNLSAVCI